jgi:hypothetical protein
LAQPRGGPPAGRSAPSLLSRGGRIGGQQGGHRRIVVVPNLVVPSMVVPSLVVPSLVVPSLVVPSLVVPELTAQGGLLAYFGEALGQLGEQRDKTIEEGAGIMGCEHT